VVRLTHFKAAVDQVLQSRLRVLTTAPAALAAAMTLSQQIGLLTNDALIVAAMQSNGLSKIASEDGDFDRVPGLTRYAPV
jgi:predicted nucleic acid-binding protein